MQQNFFARPLRARSACGPAGGSAARRDQFAAESACRPQPGRLNNRGADRARRRLSQSRTPTPIPFSAPGTSGVQETTLTTLVGVRGLRAGQQQRRRIQRLPASSRSARRRSAATNPRPAASRSSVGGTVQVAAVNVLNYFKTFGTTAGSFGVGGGATECRGADNQTRVPAASRRRSSARSLAHRRRRRRPYGDRERRLRRQQRHRRLSSTRSTLRPATGTYALVDVDAATGKSSAAGHRRHQGRPSSTSRLGISRVGQTVVRQRRSLRPIHARGRHDDRPATAPQSRRPSSGHATSSELTRRARPTTSSPRAPDAATTRPRSGQTRTRATARATAT